VVGSLIVGWVIAKHRDHDFRIRYDDFQERKKRIEREARKGGLNE
jgi:hypothetical protein